MENVELQVIFVILVFKFVQFFQIKSKKVNFQKLLKLAKIKLTKEVIYKT